jgi:hypothetical protein
VNGWMLAKYALTLLGIALVLAADPLGRRWVGYAGLALIVLAFGLRFLQRRASAKTTPRSEPPSA